MPAFILPISDIAPASAGDVLQLGNAFDRWINYRIPVGCFYIKVDAPDPARIPDEGDPREPTEPPSPAVLSFFDSETMLLPVTPLPGRALTEGSSWTHTDSKNGESTAELNWGT